MRPKTATEWIESRRIKYTAEEKAMLFEAVNAGLQMAIEACESVKMNGATVEYVFATDHCIDSIRQMKK